MRDCGRTRRPPEFTLPELPEPGSEEAIQAARNYMASRLAVPADAICLRARAYERELLGGAPGDGAEGEPGHRT